jgi:hypothetical protein
MIVQVEVGSRIVPVRLDWQHSRWHSLEDLPEGDFPLMAIVDTKRYELYSDGAFAEVER